MKFNRKKDKLNIYVPEKISKYPTKQPVLKKKIEHARKRKHGKGSGYAGRRMHWG
jgi:hypothetical protein